MPLHTRYTIESTTDAEAAENRAALNAFIETGDTAMLNATPAERAEALAKHRQAQAAEMRAVEAGMRKPDHYANQPTDADLQAAANWLRGRA